MLIYEAPLFVSYKKVKIYSMCGYAHTAASHVVFFFFANRKTSIYLECSQIN